MKVLITFLGRGEYTETEYRFSPEESRSEKEQLQRGRFASLCMAEVWQPKQIIVLATQKAKETQKERFEQDQAQLSCQPELRWREIPEGKNSEELWQIFRTMAEAVPAESKVVLDVTHSFRSLPMIGLAAARYIRRLKQAEIRHIWYGAYVPQSSGPFPVIDLSVFSEILDWVNAVQVFEEFGELGPLAKAMRGWQKLLYQTYGEDPGIKALAGTLEGLGRNLHGIQVFHIRKYASDTIKKLKIVKETSIAKGAYPLLPELLEQLQAEVEKWSASDEGSAREQAKGFLKTQYHLLLSYVKWGKHAQALILLREWLVSCALFVRKQEEGILFPEDKLRVAEEQREAMERELNELRSKGDSQPFPQELVSAWNWVVEIRNSLAHAGMNHKSRQGEILNKQIGEEIKSKAGHVANRIGLLE